MWFAPKLATVVDFSGPAGAASRFRRHPALLGERHCGNDVLPAAFGDYVGCHTMVLAGLTFGRVLVWSGQVREITPSRGPPRFGKLWLQTALGGASLAIAAVLQPAALPFLFVCWRAALSWRSRSPSSPRGPAWVWRPLQRVGIGRLPEETAPPASLTRLASLSSKPAE